VRQIPLGEEPAHSESLVASCRHQAPELFKLGEFGQKLPGAVGLKTFHGRMVKWQTRTAETRVPKGLGVQVPLRPQF